MLTDLLAIPGMSVLTKIIVVVILVLVFIHGIKDLVASIKSGGSFTDGLKSVGTELALGIAMIILFFNLELIAGLLDTIMAWVITFVEELVGYIFG